LFVCLFAGPVFELRSDRSKCQIANVCCSVTGNFDFVASGNKPRSQTILRKVSVSSPALSELYNHGYKRRSQLATEAIEQFHIATCSARSIAASLLGQLRVRPRYLLVVCLNLAP
jgi:hypothetical protein